MAVSQELIVLIKEQLARFEPIVVKNMFGGAGLFKSGIMFALVSSSDTMFFRTDDETVADFEAEGLKPFGHDHEKKKSSHMPYHQAPERVLEEPDEMMAWAEKAMQAAIRADNKKPPSQRKYQA